MTFEELVKQISPILKRITYRLNGHFSFFNDDDLYQEALLHLWMDFQAGKLNDKTQSYILQGCYFHLKNYIRTVKVKANLISLNTLISSEDTQLEEILPVNDYRAYFDILDSKFLVEKMQNNGLSKKEKEIIALFLRGLTVREIGRRLGISHVMVVKLKKRIKNKYAPFYVDAC